MDHECKRFKKDEDTKNTAKSCTRNSYKPKNSLLQSFIEYVWDNSDGECFDNEDENLIKWLRTRINLNKSDWLDSISMKFRTASKIDFVANFDDQKIDEKLWCKSMDFNDEIICAKLAYNLRKVLPMLINHEEYYENKEGQTVVHIFLKDCLGTKVVFNKSQRFRIQKLLKNFIKKGVAFFDNDNHGETPFHIVSRCGNTEIVYTLISNLSIDACDDFGNTTLHILADNIVEEENKRIDGHLDLIRFLVSKGADINRKNEDGVTPIHFAARNFHIEVLQFFEDNNTIFCQYTDENETPLHFACKYKSKLKDISRMVETINFLVSRGCGINDVDQSGFMAIHYAAERGTVEVVEKLIELGATVDPRSVKTLISPLYLATKNNQLDNMKVLVQAGADVNAEAVDGTTPLFMAVLLGSVESMQYLIDQNADVHHREKFSNLTLLHLSAFDEKFKLEDDVNSEKKQKKFHILVEKGFDLNDSGNCGITPLHFAALSRNTDVVQMLIERDANPNVKTDIEEWTPLHIALINKNLETTEILVKNGADVNSRGGINRVTPLHLALMLDRTLYLGLYPDNIKNFDRDLCLLSKWWPYERKNTFHSNYEPFVKLLIEHGADVNVSDTFGKTPLHLATLEPDVDVMRCILMAGARVNVQDVEGHLPLHNVLKFGNVKELKMLLRYGADINDDDTSKLIMNLYNKNLKDIVFKHAIKINLAGLPIAKIYESAVVQPDDYDFYNKLPKKVIGLKKHYIDEISLFEFLHMNTIRRYLYAQKILDSYDSLKKKFPIYATLIKTVCRDTIDRKLIIDAATIAWHQIFPIYLPNECIQHILSFMKNRYVQVLTLDEKINSKIAAVENERIVLKYAFEFTLKYDKIKPIQYDISISQN